MLFRTLFTSREGTPTKSGSEETPLGPPPPPRKEPPPAKSESAEISHPPTNVIEAKEGEGRGDDNSGERNDPSLESVPVGKGKVCL